MRGYASMDMGERWLKQNDPLYYKAGSRKRLQCPYLTEWQMEKRESREIPASCAWVMKEELGLTDEEAKYIIEQFK